MLIVPIALVIFHAPVGWNVLATVPALMLITINGLWVSIARYRDVPLIVASFVQVVFFVTPIFWPPEALGIWTPFLPLNPLFAPLLGQAPLAIRGPPCRS